MCFPGVTTLSMVTVTACAPCLMTSSVSYDILMVEPCARYSTELLFVVTGARKALDARSVHDHHMSVLAVDHEGSSPPLGDPAIHDCAALIRIF